MKTQKKLQEILDQENASHLKVVDKDTIQTMVDGEIETFTRQDSYSGHPLSGWANFGPVGGDHRMISGIAEDITHAFELIA